jgi:hypothetical protein
MHDDGRFDAPNCDNEYHDDGAARSSALTGGAILIGRFRAWVAWVVGATICAGPSAPAQFPLVENKSVVGDQPANPGPLSNARSLALLPAMRKVAEWQFSRIANTPSQDWSFATLYVVLLAARQTPHNERDRDSVPVVAKPLPLGFMRKSAARTQLRLSAYKDRGGIGFGPFVRHKRYTVPAKPGSTAGLLGACFLPLQQQSRLHI